MCHPDTPAEQGPSATVRGASLPLPDGEELPAEVALPDRGQGPGVVIAVDIFGCTPFYRHLNQRLAAAGYVSVLPDVFFREGELEEATREAAFARRERLDEARALRDLHATLDWLRDREEVEGARVAVVGFCLGGTFALDLCAQRDDLAAVCYYPFPAGLSGSSAPAPLDLVDRVAGPVLAFWGDQDYIDDGEIAQLGDEMARHGRDYDAVIYPGVGHGFLRGLTQGGDDRDAAEDSWQRSLAFLDRHLTGQPAAP